METLGWVLLAIWLMVFGAFVTWFAWAFVSGPRRARELIDALMLRDHEDWWAFITDGDVVGGPPRPAFAFRVLSGGRTFRPAGVCAFDTQMLLCASVHPLPWAPARRVPSGAWSKEHARFRLERRLGGDVLVAGSSRRFWLWRTTAEVVRNEMTATGWAVDQGDVGSA